MIDETEQKKNTAMEIAISMASWTFSFFVSAKAVKWRIAGVSMASGAHNSDPIRPRNLSILLAKQIAQNIAETVTKKRETFWSQ